jgi:molybdenum cofactor biosynthesis enzyme MoaA
VVLNTNAILADRLLNRPRIENLDSIYASLHTMDGEIFRNQLGGRSISKVMDNIVALKKHGYDVQINFSLGDYNKGEFRSVLEFAVRHGIDLKAITLVRPNEDPDFYRGAWIDPQWISAQIEATGARVVGSEDAFGGQTTTYAIGGMTVKVKNIARGRLETDFCSACTFKEKCGEGIYGLRVGIDGLWKPCLLRHERFRSVTQEESYESQILTIIDEMIGSWENARFLTGAPA